MAPTRMAVVRAYLSTARTASARELAAKAAILVEPQQLVGKSSGHGPLPRVGILICRM
jgi:hypothetical protein